MNSKNLRRRIFIHSVNAAWLIAIGAAPLFAQKLRITSPPKPQPEGFGFGYILILLAGIALGGAVIHWFNRKKIEIEGSTKKLNTLTPVKRHSKSIDADLELEWLRKNSETLWKMSKKQNQSRKTPAKKTSERLSEINHKGDEFTPFWSDSIENKDSHADVPMPVFAIDKIDLAIPVDPLPVSDDEVLLCAIEQATENFEDDEEVRDLVLNILSAFKASNSVEAISQIALYDSSATLRSKAVLILSEFDHELVFETILLACADSNRAVQAAAARGLFRLSFERTNCWLRIAESGEPERIRQSVRAVINGNLVKSSLERLIHQDKKYAAEAFAITVLLIKSRETDEIFKILQNHSDINVIKTILHVISITGEPDSLEKLNSMLEKPELTDTKRQEVAKILEANRLVSA